MNLPHKYPYNPRWRMILFAAAFFGGCFWIMAHKAAHNEAGVVINGIITLGPAGATIFYWVIAVAAALFVLMAGVLSLRRILSPRALELGLDALLLPHGFLQTKSMEIKYSDFQRISEVEVSGQTFLYVFVKGRKFTITASLLPSKEIYAEVKEFLRSRVPVPALAA